MGASLPGWRPVGHRCEALGRRPGAVASAPGLDPSSSGPRGARMVSAAFVLGRLEESDTARARRRRRTHNTEKSLTDILSYVLTVVPKPIPSQDFFFENRHVIFFLSVALCLCAPRAGS